MQEGFGAALAADILQQLPYTSSNVVLLHRGKLAGCVPVTELPALTSSWLGAASGLEAQQPLERIRSTSQCAAAAACVLLARACVTSQERCLCAYLRASPAGSTITGVHFMRAHIRTHLLLRAGRRPPR